MALSNRCFYSNFHRKHHHGKFLTCRLLSYFDVSRVSDKNNSRSVRGWPFFTVLRLDLAAIWNKVTGNSNQNKTAKKYSESAYLRRKRSRSVICYDILKTINSRPQIGPLSFVKQIVRLNVRLKYKQFKFFVIFFHSRLNELWIVTRVQSNQTKTKLMKQ